MRSLLLAVQLSALIAAPAVAAPTIITAEDLNYGDPGGGNTNNSPTNIWDGSLKDVPGPLSPTPNVTAARATFVGLFTSIDVVSFEGHPHRHMLSTVLFPLASVTGTFLNAALAPSPVEVLNFGTCTSGPSNLCNDLDGTLSGTYPTDGTNFVFSAAGQSTRQLRIGFNNPINAFAATFTDLGDVGGTLQVVLTRQDGSTSTYPAPSGAAAGPGNQDNLTGSVLFWGIYDDTPFTRVSFEYLGAAADGFGLDELIVGVKSQVRPPEDDECEGVAPLCEGSGEVLWGSMELAGGTLRGFRCVVTPGQAPVCDTNAAGVLIDYEPMCL